MVAGVGYQSKAQRKFLRANKPELAKEFAALTPKGAKLPNHVKPQKAVKK